jgi:hypothetical protein
LLTTKFGNIAVIEFKHPDDATSALQELNNLKIEGKIINIEYFDESQYMITPNNQIMDEWLKKHKPIKAYKIFVGLDFIPLSLIEFLNWFITNQPDITFIFPIIIHGKQFRSQLKYYIQSIYQEKPIYQEQLENQKIVQLSLISGFIYIIGKIYNSDDDIFGWKELYDKKISINKDINIIEQFVLNNNRAIKYFFNPALKFRYTRIYLVHESNLDEWEKIFQHFISNVNASKVFFNSTVLPRRLMKKRYRI